VYKFVDRYTHTYHFGGVIRRVEALRSILYVLKRLRVPFFREPERLPGWREGI
jgi:hypothetical protein